MTFAAETAMAVLAEQGKLPGRHAAVYVAGSLARGWHHENSDVDVYVFTDQRWASDTCDLAPVDLKPDTVPTEIFYADGLRWEARYWLPDQFDQMMAKANWADFLAGKQVKFSEPESILLARILHALPLAGPEWLEQRRAEVLSSAYQASVVTVALDNADGRIEDAAGLLATGDADSAVLAAHHAFQHTIDALVASLGELDTTVRWRARRMKATEPDIISFDDYWAIETMRGLSDSDRGAWVHHVLRTCQRIIAEIKVY